MTTLLERFLHYLTFHTRSDATNPACPSSEGQLVFARALFDDPSSAPLHPDFVCHSGGAEAAALPWGSAVAADLVAVDALGSDAALVRARVDGALVALVWVQLPAGWCLRFLG